jgi:4-hydroxy-tetrahydrodipicolinate synthase
MYPLFRGLFVEPNPAPIKHAMARAGVISSAEVRLPLCELSADSRKVLNALLAAARRSR